MAAETASRHIQVTTANSTKIRAPGQPPDGDARSGKYRTPHSPGAKPRVDCPGRPDCRNRRAAVPGIGAPCSGGRSVIAMRHSSSSGRVAAHHPCRRPRPAPPMPAPELRLQRPAAPATSPDDPGTKQRPPARAAHHPVLSGTPGAAPGTLAARRAPGFPEGLAARHQGWQGRPHGRFLPLWMYRNTKSEGNGRSAYRNQMYERLMHTFRQYEWNTA